MKLLKKTLEIAIIGPLVLLLLWLCFCWILGAAPALAYKYLGIVPAGIAWVIWQISLVWLYSKRGDAWIPVQLFALVVLALLGPVQMLEMAGIEGSLFWAGFVFYGLVISGSIAVFIQANPESQGGHESPQHKIPLLRILHQRHA